MTEQGTDNNVIPRVAEINFNSVIEARNRILDEVSASSRWILATLVTVNAGLGGLILTSDKVDANTKFYGSSWAGVGVICAVLLGYSMILSAQRLITRLNELAGSWMAGMMGREFDVSKLVLQESGLKRAIRPWQIAGHLFGWASLVCFVVSGLIIAFGTK